MRYSFENDYSEGASREIMEALIQCNFEQNTGYGLDTHCINAANLIRKECGNDEMDVHFIPGGTPCNVLAISLLRPYESVICADTGHINGHETGAVEHTGHKILTVPNDRGKVHVEDIEKVILSHTNEHETKPKMVYISQSTELGTTYSYPELTAIKKICVEYGLFLYIDGARLASGLLAERMSLKDIADLADIFYIGGTKNGALYGEAMCIVNPALKKDFRYLIKQNCTMLAKSFALGIQFEQLFTNNLYFRNGELANYGADRLREIFEKYNIPLYVRSRTNQIFVIMEDTLIYKLKKEFRFEKWLQYDDFHSVVRFVTSFTVRQKNIDDFEKYLSTCIYKEI